nr:hypothetical protein [Mycoplasmopsis bovis]
MMIAIIDIPRIIPNLVNSKFILTLEASAKRPVKLNPAQASLLIDAKVMNVIIAKH